TCALPIFCALLCLEVRGVERARIRLEIIAEVRGALVAHVRCVFLIAAFRQTRREARAHAAHVQLRAAARALVAARERQRERREGVTATIKKQCFGHRKGWPLPAACWYFA